MRKELLKTRSVLFVFDLLRSISRVKIVLKLTPVVDLVKRIAGFSSRLVLAVDIICRFIIGTVQRDTFRLSSFDLIGTVERYVGVRLDILE